MKGGMKKVFVIVASKKFELKIQELRNNLGYSLPDKGKAAAPLAVAEQVWREVVFHFKDRYVRNREQ